MKKAVRRTLSVCCVALTVGAVGAPAAWATEETDNAGPMNVSLTGDSAGGVNDSTFIAVAAGAVPAGAEITATASTPAGAVAIPAYALPVGGTNPLTGGNNATVWVPTPTDATNVVLSWSGGTPPPPNYSLGGTPADGASISVSQDTVGSGAITVTAIFPRFSQGGVSISREFFELPSREGGFGNYGFYVFDADTKEVIDPERPGIRKRWISDSLLELSDPLVLPASALGRNIRVGFATYYYTSDFRVAGTIPIRYAGLSAAILMRLGGSVPGGGPVAALQQFAVPAGTLATGCASLAPAHVDDPALAQLREEGWSVSYANWPNGGSGGWVCQRQPIYTSLGWIVQ